MRRPKTAKPPSSRLVAFSGAAVALMHAAAGNAVDVVRYLLGEGVAWNDVDDDGDCAGQYASGHGHLELAGAMMEHAVASELAAGERRTAATAEKREALRGLGLWFLREGCDVAEDAAACLP